MDKQAKQLNLYVTHNEFPLISKKTLLDATHNINRRTGGKEKGSLVLCIDTEGADANRIQGIYAATGSGRKDKWVCITQIGLDLVPVGDEPARDPNKPDIARSFSKNLNVSSSITLPAVSNTHMKDVNSYLNRNLANLEGSYTSVFCEEDNKMYFSEGSSPTNKWVSMDGISSITPSGDFLPQLPKFHTGSVPLKQYTPIGGTQISYSRLTLKDLANGNHPVNLTRLSGKNIGTYLYVPSYDSKGAITSIVCAVSHGKEPTSSWSLLAAGSKTLVIPSLHNKFVGFDSFGGGGVSYKGEGYSVYPATSVTYSGVSSNQLSCKAGDSISATVRKGSINTGDTWTLLIFDVTNQKSRATLNLTSLADGANGTVTFNCTSDAELCFAVVCKDPTAESSVLLSNPVLTLTTS